MANIDITRGYVPGVLGRVVELHGKYYHEYWGFGLFFESRVAADLAEFLERYDAVRDGFWVAAADGSVEGSIAIDGLHAEDEGAHLRWFIVSDILRGTGVGARLLDTAIEYCRQRRYSRIYLHTFEGLAAARHLYEKCGFLLVEQTTGTQWGTEVNEQKFLLEIHGISPGSIGATLDHDR
ncbi:MAG: GNAT family N-acetyltransferase [Gammaproteobacteria bacterium]|nr:GNAT family N-acetyltransferase [Gammaproteobacteria bacterium]